MNINMNINIDINMYINIKIKINITVGEVTTPPPGIEKWNCMYIYRKYIFLGNVWFYLDKYFYRLNIEYIL